MMTIGSTGGEFPLTAQTIAQQQDGRGALRAFWLTALAMGLVIAQAIAAQARPDSFADLADTVSPAVVNILSLIHI